MRRIIAACLLLSMSLSLFGCASGASEEKTVETVQESQASENQAVETIPAVEEPVETEPEGTPLLTVSAITFCLPGESEDIYTGTTPRDRIQWQSEDEAVALFEDGIVTVTGPGTTTVTAVYQEQTLTAQVTCLAESEEALKKVSRDTLRLPKRLPPVVEDIDVSFFDDVAFVGDSISYTLEHRSPVTGEIGNPVYLVRGGVSLNGFIRGYKRISFRGKEMDLEDAIVQAGVKKVFLMMGQNDLGYRTIEATMESWQELLTRIWEKSPDVEVYIQSLVPEWKDDYSSNEKNEKIDTYNEVLKTFADEQGCRFVEVAAYFEDCANKMSSLYTSDYKIHINFVGADVWMQVLRAYLQTLQVKGEI